MFKTKTYSKSHITAIEMATPDEKSRKNLQNSVDAFAYQNSTVNSTVNFIIFLNI